MYGCVQAWAWCGPSIEVDTMLRGFYTAASGMLAQQRRNELLANNLANANTPGFKTDQTSVRSFPEMLLQRMDYNTAAAGKQPAFPANTRVGSVSTGVYVQEAAPLFSQGGIQQTDQQTDLAIINGTLPEGSTIMFAVENGEGETRYTRNGNFTLDREGYLTAPSGQYILDSSNRRIRMEGTDFQVNEDGYILENGQTKARIGAVFAENQYSLVKEGDGLFRAEEGAGMSDAYTQAGASFTVRQGVLETSNVDQSRTMTEMMAAYRSFEANQKVLQAYDKSLDKAVNEIGRIG